MGLEWALYPLAGILAGLMAGLLGVGGGLVLMPILVFLLPLQGVDEADPRERLVPFEHAGGHPA